MKRDHRRSEELATRARARLPGGVNSNVRLEIPRMFFERGEGAWLWDVDGNDVSTTCWVRGRCFSATPLPRCWPRRRRPPVEGWSTGPRTLRGGGRRAPVRDPPLAADGPIRVVRTEMVQALRLARARNWSRPICMFRAAIITGGWTTSWSLSTGGWPAPVNPLRLSPPRLFSHRLPVE